MQFKTIIAALLLTGAIAHPLESTAEVSNVEQVSAMADLTAAEQQDISALLAGLGGGAGGAPGDGAAGGLGGMFCLVEGVGFLKTND